jgi:hypothetical protein
VTMIHLMLWWILHSSWILTSTHILLLLHRMSWWRWILRMLLILLLEILRSWCLLNHRHIIYLSLTLRPQLHLLILLY